MFTKRDDCGLSHNNSVFRTEDHFDFYSLSIYLDVMIDPMELTMFLPFHIFSHHSLELISTLVNHV